MDGKQMVLCSVLPEMGPWNIDLVGVTWTRLFAALSLPLDWDQWNK